MSPCVCDCPGVFSSWFSTPELGHNAPFLHNRATDFTMNNALARESPIIAFLPFHGEGLEVRGVSGGVDVIDARKKAQGSQYSRELPGMVRFPVLPRALT
jgi:hypothetical protein